MRLLRIATILLSLSAGTDALGQGVWGQRVTVDNGVNVTVDERPAVFRIDVKDWEDDYGGVPTNRDVVYPTLLRLNADLDQWHPSIVSVSMLIAASKRFDDRLLATIELMAQRGGNNVGPGKRALLAALADELTRKLEPKPANGAALLESLARVTAARRMDETAGDVPASVRSRVESLIAEFDANAFLSKPLGFYTSSPELSRLFRQDRFLQQIANVGGLDAEWLLALSSLVRENAKLESSLRSILGLAGIMANEGAALSPLEIGPGSIGRAAFLPARRSHESELLRRVYGSKPIPDGHKVMEDLLAGIRKGEIRLDPTPTSGWYDWQTWVIEPLVRADAKEEKKIRRAPNYVRHCEENFKSALTQRRETHVKDLEGPVIGSPAAIWIMPTITVEPQITLLRRIADSYAFIRGALEARLGRDALAAEPLLSLSRDEPETVLAGLTRIEARFRGLAAIACCEVGGDPGLLGPSVTEATANKLAQEARSAWMNTASASDLEHDPRVMVPIGYDVERGEVRCWAVVGLAHRDLWITYEEKPVVTARDQAGRTVDARIYTDRGLARVPYEIWIECSVKVPLTRDELRAVCDRCSNLGEIKAALRAVR